MADQLYRKSFQSLYDLWRSSNILTSDKLEESISMAGDPRLDIDKSAFRYVKEELEDALRCGDEIKYAEGMDRLGRVPGMRLLKSAMSGAAAWYISNAFGEGAELVDAEGVEYSHLMILRSLARRDREMVRRMGDACMENRVMYGPRPYLGMACYHVLGDGRKEVSERILESSRKIFGEAAEWDQWDYAGGSYFSTLLNTAAEMYKIGTGEWDGPRQREEVFRMVRRAVKGKPIGNEGVVRAMNQLYTRVVPSKRRLKRFSMEQLRRGDFAVGLEMLAPDVGLSSIAAEYGKRSPSELLYYVADDPRIQVDRLIYFVSGRSSHFKDGVYNVLLSDEDEGEVMGMIRPESLHGSSRLMQYASGVLLRRLDEGTVRFLATQDEMNAVRGHVEAADDGFDDDSED